ncbi:30572_t:CDS:2 [Gigaspora margarita]|uniref:30572_t:CDS:1 n=1 Tax=Gigaspora margarita TaxID=4874 RepID=A0ABN7UN14_GIGMA|nr:30572_t:CDS:2 [Gigaspora margarita]
MSKIKIRKLNKSSLTPEGHKKYLHHFLNPPLSSEIDESLQFSKQSNEFYASLISTRDANNYGDDFLLAAQKFINETLNDESLPVYHDRALISCSEPSEFSDFSEDSDYRQPLTSSSARSKHPHVAGPILDQQQAVNIFCNYQGYKKYIIVLFVLGIIAFILKKNYDTVGEIIGLANNVLFGSSQEQNYILISQNEELKVKNKKVEERNHALETENSNLKVKNKEIEERSNALESQNIILKTENAELKLKDDDQTKLKTIYAVLVSEHENLILSNKELEAKITQSENKFKDINKRYGELLTEHSNLEVIYTTLEGNYKALQAHSGKNEIEIKNLEKELKEIQDEKDKVTLIMEHKKKNCK